MTVIRLVARTSGATGCVVPATCDSIFVRLVPESGPTTMLETRLAPASWHTACISPCRLPAAAKVRSRRCIRVTGREVWPLLRPPLPLATGRSGPSRLIGSLLPSRYPKFAAARNPCEPLEHEDYMIRVDARRQPGQVAPGPHHLVLRDLRARAEPARLSAVSSRASLPVQLVLRGGRAARPRPQRGLLCAADRGGSLPLPPPCGRGDGIVLRRARRLPRSIGWSSSWA